MNAPSTPQDFKKKRRIGVMLTLPSGNVVKVKGVDLVSLVVTGQVPNSLLSTIQKHLGNLEGGEEPTVEDAAKMAEELPPEELAKVFSLMDTLVVAIAMEPKIYPVPENEDERDESLLYVDELDGEDKLFMFNWSQEGLNKMKRFPGATPERMDALEEVGVDALASGDPVGSLIE